MLHGSTCCPVLACFHFTAIQLLYFLNAFFHSIQGSKSSHVFFQLIFVHLATLPILFIKAVLTELIWTRNDTHLLILWLSARAGVQISFCYFLPVLGCALNYSII